MIMRHMNFHFLRIPFSFFLLITQNKRTID
jgi:hypothetical protein